jgi:YD repeat-containing protein
VDQNGNVFFADPAGNRIYKSDAARVVTVFKEQTGGARALRVGADGRLYATQPAPDGSCRTVPRATRRSSRRTSRPTTWRSPRSGAIYYVDTAHKTVGYIDEQGQRRIVYDGLARRSAERAEAAGEIMSPTALTLTPDQAMLLGRGRHGRYQWSFQIAADGSLVNGEPFQRLEMPEEGCSAASAA